MYWQAKVAIVTGGSSGLGLALGRSLARSGAEILLVGRDAGRLGAAMTACQELQTAGSVTAVSADITVDQDVQRVLETARQRFGRIDALFNCAGRSSRGKIEDTTVEGFRELLELNFLALVRTTRAALPDLLASQGHVVQIGSLAAKSASKFLGGYPASKFPVAAYAQQLRLELGPRGLHVLLVCPGPIARPDAGQRYDAEAADLPPAARRPGGGVKLKGLDPDRLADRILNACRRRKAELVVPAKARLLFTLSQCSPAWGDWLINRFT